MRYVAQAARDFEFGCRQLVVIVGRLFALTVSFFTMPNEPGLVTVTVRTVPARSFFFRNGVRLTVPEAFFFVKTTFCFLRLTFFVGQPLALAGRYEG